MRPLKKIGALLYLLAAIVVVGACVGTWFGPRDVADRIEVAALRPVGQVVMVISLVVLGLGVLITVLAVVTARKPAPVVHPAGNPNIEVRLAAISSVARAAVRHDDVMVESVRTRTVGRGDAQVKVTLELIALTNSGLEALGRQIQCHVQEACEEMLGVPGVTVLTRFLPSKTTTVIKEVSGE